MTKRVKITNDDESDHSVLVQTNRLEFDESGTVIGRVTTDTQSLVKCGDYAFVYVYQGQEITISEE